MNDLINAEVNFTNRAQIAPGVTDYTLLNSDDHYEINGGVLSDSRLSWMSCGPRLTIINNIDGSVRNGWTFGKVKEDSTVKITCVSELQLESLSNLILIVGCESANHGGTVSFYHTGSSQILKTIQFNHKVVSLAVVEGKDESNLPLAGYIKSWSGVLAVGTGQGALYLVDLWKRGLEKCIVDFHFRTCDEQHISRLSLITFQKVDPTLNYRKLSINNGRTTEALFLNEYTLMKNGLNHQLPRSSKQIDISMFPRDEVIVTAIEFFPNICTLAVGYNVSSFQLWDLRDFTLLYKSPIMEINLPVCKFALLEPSDDPRYVCYLWCLQQSSGEQKSLPFGAMFLMNYESKVNNSFYGNIYQDFCSCAKRFELDFGDEIPSVEDGRIISCRTANNNRISKSVAYSLRSEDLNTEESCLTQLIITWEVWSHNREEVSNMITIFDLNQWYKEHMPDSSLAEYKGYMTHLTLQQFEEDTLLDVRINEQSLKPFSALYHLDQHYFPSSLSFDCVCLYRLNIVRCSRTGIQKACLDAIERGGPTALLNPTPLFKLCDYVGVKPLLADLTSNHVNNLSIKEQREVVLSIALENNMNGFLYQCVQEWADGSHAVAGSTLPALLGWAWGRVTLYKHTADKLCIPLFDYSGVRLDFNDCKILEHCVRQLHSLNKLFCLVMDKFKVFVLEDNLEQQCTALGLVSLYLDSVLWFLRNGVLPESLDGDDVSSDNHIPYLVNRITGSTKARRVELEYIASHQKNECPSSGLFFIDALINQECGSSHLTDQWELEGGATTLGKYPPPSVQSLLRIYLIRGIPTLYKHYIVIYFILDVINHLDSKRYNEHIERLLMFPTMFRLTNSQSRTIQAFWDLDHKHFEEGVNHLLHPDVCKQDLKCYQHRTILHLLVSEGKHKLALRYLNLKKPPLCEDDDIKFEMNILLFNGMMLEAFSFQRQHQSLQMELLHQFFTRCFEVNKVDVIYKLPMNATEEMAFSKFLESNQKHKGEDLSVYYLVSRSRYLEAIDLHNKFRTVAATCRRMSKPSTGLTPIGSRGFNIFGTKDNLTSGTPSDTVLTTRDLIINAISKTLPSVTKELTDHFSKEKQILPSSKQIQRPTPLSVAVHTEIQSDRLPRYRTSSSKFMEAALTKIRETWAPLLATPAALKSRTKTHMSLEDMPFLRTPSGQHRFNPTIVNRPLSPVLEKKAKRRQTGYFDSPNKRSKLEAIISEGDKHSAKKDFSSSDSLLIINTPHVPRAVTIKNTIVSTPQSILKIKGKQIPNTSFMPELTPPRETNVKDECHSTVKSMLSNRQIRFSLPNNESPPSSPSFEEADSTQNETPIKPLLVRSSQSSILSRDLTPARKSLRTSWATSSMKQHILTRNISESRPSNKSTSNSSQKYTTGPLVSSEKDEDESPSGTVESYCLETPRPENVNENDDENREDSILSEELKSPVEIEPSKFNIEYKLVTKDSISTDNTSDISNSLGIEPLKFSFDYELVNREDKELIEGYKEEANTTENIATVMESKQCDVSKIVETFSPSRDNSNKQYLSSFIVKTNESISLPQTSTPVYNKFFFGDPNRKIPTKLESENKNVTLGDGQNIFTTSLNENRQSDITPEMKSNEIREDFTFKEKN
uniref:ELYS beta-propeller domain-containing protein n=1 Tax=Clastoptera arizonana TaxID=38151 RepID=A0A1B6DYT2_9HEMI